MAHKMKYHEDADVLTVILRAKGKLSRAEEVGDIIVHFGEDGRPFLTEIPRASKIVPLMAESLGKERSNGSLTDSKNEIQTNQRAGKCFYILA